MAIRPYAAIMCVTTGRLNVCKIGHQEGVSLIRTLCCTKVVSQSASTLDAIRHAYLVPDMYVDYGEVSCTMATPSATYLHDLLQVPGSRYVLVSLL